MKREFTNENFERFLKQSADSFRMKAPDKVWQNLSKELNKRRRRFVIGLSVFLLVSSAIGYYTISNVSQQSGASSNQVNQQQNANSNIKESQKNSETVLVPSSTISNNIETTTRANTSNNDKRNFSLRTHLPVNDPVGNKIKTGINNSQNSILPLQPLAKDNFVSTVVDSYEFDKQDAVAKKDNRQSSVYQVLPLTIESVINSYKRKARGNKLETELYFAPTISYRKLTENKSYLRSIDANAAPGNYPALYTSVNSNVTHKPDVGFELGLAVKYPLSNKLKLRSGIQFNVNRYDVKAFSSPVSVATIALNGGGGTRVDSFNTISSYSNVNGYKSNWLQNLSFQVSAPIGVEYSLKKTNKIEFGIAGTFQPTYILGDRAFLITTDYKRYTQVPWLVRRWNVNTAFETFVVYQPGKTRWQIGPQVRYQLLSSFDSKYPVKENLFDFGFKLGISLNK